ncbi:hypothetical protein V8E53_015079 [Lactarius tabidus]
MCGRRTSWLIYAGAAVDRYLRFLQFSYTPPVRNLGQIHSPKMQSTSARPPTRIGTGVSANANQDGNTRSGGADDKSSALTNEAVEAAMASEMERFIERGPPSIPARGPSSNPARAVQLPHPSSSTSSSTAQPVPNASTTGTGRGPVQTATANTALRKKK